MVVMIRELTTTRTGIHQLISTQICIFLTILRKCKCIRYRLKAVNKQLENAMNNQKIEGRLMDYFTKASHNQLKQELEESRQITELCYAMLLGSVLLNIVLAWLIFNG
jgi:hypothetical protein